MSNTLLISSGPQFHYLVGGGGRRVCKPCVILLSSSVPPNYDGCKQKHLWIGLQTPPSVLHPLFEIDLQTGEIYISNSFIKPCTPADI